MNRKFFWKEEECEPEFIQPSVKKFKFESKEYLRIKGIEDWELGQILF